MEVPNIPQGLEIQKRYVMASLARSHLQMVMEDSPQVQDSPKNSQSLHFTKGLQASLQQLSERDGRKIAFSNKMLEW